MMKKTFYMTSLLMGILLLGGACSNDESNTPPTESMEVLSPKDVTKSNPMKVYVHYMPWFETPETNNGTWGQHWTMATCNPDIQDANGKRQIASHYYPLIGPYASSDPDVLDYHLLLMKYAGVDGVMIDWYGTQDKNDYPTNKRNTEALVEALDRVGLDFAIVYEDATLADLSDKTTQAMKDMKYLQNYFFKKENYVKYNNVPLLLVFGPQQLKSAEEWHAAFGVLDQQPALAGLYNQAAQANDNTYKNAIGEYVWCDPNPSAYYNGNAKNFELCIGGAMPGFNDYYQEGEWGEGYTSYDHEGGALFDRQLQEAQDAGLNYLQISTWNDFGEGTNIEPTEEYNYLYLTKLQDYIGVTYTQAQLELIYSWYELKQKYTDIQSEEAKALTQAFYYLIALQPDKAEEILTGL